MTGEPKFENREVKFPPDAKAPDKTPVQIAHALQKQREGLIETLLMTREQNLATINEIDTALEQLGAPRPTRAQTLSALGFQVSERKPTVKKP